DIESPSSLEGAHEGAPKDRAGRDSISADTIQATSAEPPPPDRKVRLGAGIATEPPGASAEPAGGATELLERVEPSRPMSVLAPGTILDGTFRVIEEIGRGGMGAVFLVEHLALGKRFAAKVLARGATPAAIERLRHEARITGGLQHDNIVRVTHLGETPDGSVFVVMELLQGENLAERLNQQRSQGAVPWLPDPISRRIIEEVLEGLEAAHAASVIHRDLKPENVFLATVGDRRRAKIVDFGISKLLDGGDGARLTKTGEIFGTPLYMAPEQAQDMSLADGRTDLYSLGVMAFEMVTGRLPFEATSAVAALMAHGTQKPPKPRHLRADLPVSVQNVILQALEKRPDRRHASAGQMLEAWRAAWGGPAEEMSTSGELMQESMNAGQQTLPVERAAPRDRPPLLWALGAAVLLLGLGAALFFIGAGESSPEASASSPLDAPGAEPVALVPAPLQAASEPPLPAEPEGAADAGLEAASPAGRTHLLRTTPPGAEVWIEGERVGTTPHELRIEAGATVEISLRKRGYRAARIRLEPESEAEITRRLSRIRSAPGLAPL
ncbi:MAG: protein kinase, partial [Myxococcales bacterium]|nr:protein kinase [Myxococcales bacterium]